MTKHEIFVAYEGDTSSEYLIIEAKNQTAALAEAMAWVCPWDVPTELKVTRVLVGRKWEKVNGIVKERTAKS